jgi:hypothetical protein
MKNRQSFLTAFLMGTIMIVWYDVFLLLTNDLTATLDQDKVGLFLLQAVIVIKFIGASVVVMPSAVNIKQLIAGYLTADLLFSFPLFWSKPQFSFSVEMVVAQVVLSLIYVASQRRISAKPRLVSEWGMSGDLIFQGI